MRSNRRELRQGWFCFAPQLVVRMPALLPGLLIILTAPACTAHDSNPPPKISSAQNNSSTLEQVRSDVRLVVGGNFSAAALGPDVYHQVQTRIKAHARDALKEFEALFLDENFDALAQSKLYLPSFLTLVAPIEPELTRTVASKLKRHYDLVLTTYDSAKNKEAFLAALSDAMATEVQRLAERREELGVLLK